VGVNTLFKYKDAEIDMTNWNIINHSGRVFCCTTLYNKGYGDQ